MFELVYWCGINNDQGEFITEIVEIDKMRYINFGIDKFLKFTNESGQVNIILIENINRLKELD
ncbi:hypothetical protein A8C35_09055 [Ligilactobacillus salivarius]|uniref:hypothetical protein n=1 Tax=Ligilactobacillus salivarius TaxID=1624 RepID=UPI000BB07980|nr:hypothetical protein [Ligilactobacillus salivarius]PAY32470.1 hypothetical protein A8C35_09055 [Ligilactobacillus salivarius]